MKWKFTMLGFLVGIVFSVVSFLLFSIYLFGNLEAKIAKAGQNNIREKFQVLKDSIAVISINSTRQAKTIALTSDLIVLNFWATWCGPCKKEMPGFQSLIEKTSPGVKFYFLSEESFEKQQQTIHQAGWSLPFFKTDTTIMKRYTSMLPTTYVIKNGVVILKQEGELDWGNPMILDFLERLK